MQQLIIADVGTRFIMSVKKKTEHDILIDKIFDLFKGQDYLSVKETLDDCLIILEIRAKVV